jgi:NAD-reducing hydrogenase small subunit
VPREVIPALIEKARPVHEVVKVDVFIPGCPPSAETIFLALSDLLADRMPDMAKLTRFGA